ncbi:hypothetical protein SEA_EUGENEKRABS_8 [Microbacterium phage EugeneKrabs]|nr:hypothetical protein SEA_EUGENEKRABS_8 [Microbacterium phage EugeneKrabs]
MPAKLVLVGIDPGIVDTALAVISLNFESKTIDIYSKVWTSVTRRENNKPVVDAAFLNMIDATIRSFRVQDAAVFIGIEGYRQRGMNVWQDQAMLALIDHLEERITFSEIIDNVGMKQIVPRPLLKLFHVARFPKSSNHADRVSAARVALRRGIKDENINKLLSDYVLDNTEDEPWSLAFMQTL